MRRLDGIESLQFIPKLYAYTMCIDIFSTIIINVNEGLCGSQTKCG